MSLQTTNQSLDELAKGLATGTLSRGKALRWMGGALLGAALASFPGVAWANDCRRLGRECRRDSQCCSKNCVRRGDEKVCACPEGKSRCNDRCVNLKRSERHCGSCFNRCEAGEECVRGECQGGGCPPGGTPTEGDCTCAFTCGADANQFSCSDNTPNCVCSLTIEGFGFCAAPGAGVCPPECSSSSECGPEGSACVVNTCCEHPVCANPCTPTCLQNGSICSAETEECCSGICDGGMCSACQDANGCPQPDNQCQQATCTNGVCGVENLPDDTPCNLDDNECTIDVCTAGVCVSTQGCEGELCFTNDDCCECTICVAGECHEPG